MNCKKITVGRRREGGRAGGAVSTDFIIFDGTGPLYCPLLYSLFFFLPSDSLSMCVWVCLILVFLTVVPILFLLFPHVSRLWCLLPFFSCPCNSIYISTLTVFFSLFFYYRSVLSTFFLWRNPIHTHTHSTWDCHAVWL